MAEELFQIGITNNLINVSESVFFMIKRPQNNNEKEVKHSSPHTEIVPHSITELEIEIYRKNSGNTIPVNLSSLVIEDPFSSAVITKGNTFTKILICYTQPVGIIHKQKQQVSDPPENVSVGVKE